MVRQDSKTQIQRIDVNADDNEIRESDSETKVANSDSGGTEDPDSDYVEETTCETTCV